MMLDHIVKDLCDFRTIPLPIKMLEIRIDSLCIEREMLDAATRFLTIRPAEDAIQTGDIVAIEQKGELIRVNVGRGSTDEILEQTLFGKKAGDTLQSAGKIKSVKRRYIPELTDELVRKLEINGVSTVADYRVYLFRKAADREKRKKLQGIQGYLTKELLERSMLHKPPRDHALVELQYKAYKKQVERVAQQQGKPVGEILAPFFGLKKRDSEAEQWDELRSETVKAICIAAIGWCYARQDGVIFTEESVLENLRQLAQERSVSLEAVVNGRASQLLVLEAYYNYLGEKLQTYYKNKFKILEV